MSAWVWILIGTLFGPVLLGMSAWTALAIRYTAPLPAPLRKVLGPLAPVAFVAAGALTGHWWIALGLFFLLFCAVATWFSSIEPRARADWEGDVAVLPRVRWSDGGQTITVLDLRWFDYRADGSYDARYVERSFDLEALQAVDLIVSYWDHNKAIAHTMLSFDFGGDDVLCVSVEVRRKKGDSWAALPGLFKQYEIIYVLGDERDLVRLRAVYRQEEVFLFRTEATPEASRALLGRILEHAAHLRNAPEFYRTIGQNCTTSLVDHINSIWPDRVPYTRKILMNGYAPEQAFESGLLCTNLPFDEYKQRSQISQVAREVGDAEDFSRRIRIGLPRCEA